MNRKLDHINHSLELHSYINKTFSDIKFVHHSLPGGDLSNISTETEFLDHTINFPFFINAMTGGGGKTTFKINKGLARICKKNRIPMAVGSQMASLKDTNEIKTYEIVRDVNPDGIILANIGAESKPYQAKEVVDMLSADSLQIHLNHIQEIVMPEGDRSFSQRLLNISKIIEKLDVPVTVKEVGFGISKETVKLLESLGVAYIDIGGKGGTNFSKIENNRRRHSTFTLFDDWGIPTPCSLIEALAVSKKANIISSGGIKDGLDIVKCLALGAKICGISSSALRILVEQGEESLESHIEVLSEQIHSIMLALGAHSIEELTATDLVISGETDQWLHKRGVDTSFYSQRKK